MILYAKQKSFTVNFADFVTKLIKSPQLEASMLFLPSHLLSKIIKEICKIYLTFNQIYVILFLTRGCMYLPKNLKLKSARAALDLSQQQLAEKVGVTRQTLNAIESGDYNPTINLCKAICKVLGKTLDELFWDD